MENRKKILATVNDIGGSQAMIPVLKQLQQRGWDVVCCAEPDAPAYPAFESSGLDLVPLCAKGSVSTPGTMDEFIRRENPDVICVGVSGNDIGSEKLALDVAIKRAIPTCLVLESWPNAWLGSFGERDIPSYSQVDLVCVCDETARETLLEAGFPSQAVVVTGNPCHDSLYQFIAGREKYRHEMREFFRIPEDANVVMWAITWDLDDESQQNPDSPEWLGFSERDVFQEFLRAMAKNAQGDDRIRGLVRQKPSYGSVQARKYINEICPSVVFDNSRQPMGIPPLLAADLIIGCRTIVIQTAALLGLPAVYYMPGISGPDPMVTNKLGITVPMYRPGMLQDLINDFRATPAETVTRLLSQMRIPTIPRNAAEIIATNVIERLLKED